MRLRQFTLFNGFENLIRVLVGFEITVDIENSLQDRVFAHELIYYYLGLSLLSFLYWIRLCSIIYCVASSSSKSSSE